MPSRVGIAWVINNDNEETEHKSEFHLVKCQIYEDEKGILRWEIEKIGDFLSIEEAIEDTRFLAEKARLPCIEGRGGWIHACGYCPVQPEPEEAKLNIDTLAESLEPERPVTAKQIYTLYPEAKTTPRMPFAVLKDWVKDQL